MNLHTLLFTENECYKANQEQNSNITPRGLMLHSTGSNNPWVKRYVGPNDGYVGTNKNNNHWNQKMSRQACTHGFIGKAENGEICTYQTLPWNYFGWHSGSGSKGKDNNANNTGYLGFEICEDGLTDKNYFNAVYKEAVEVFAMLADKFNIPVKSPYVICHSEGYALGIASNHADVMHWFKKHGKTMDTFRADVEAQVKNLRKKEEPKEEEKKELAIGDVVNFLGGKVYTNANASSTTKTAAAGPAKVKDIYKGKHPYLLLHTDKQSSVYGWVDADTIKELQDQKETLVKEDNKMTEQKIEQSVVIESKPEIKVDKYTFKVGDIVYFRGGNHFSNANARQAASSTIKAGPAKVTAKYVAGDHPYLLKGVSGKGSNVYGWVDCADIDPTPVELEEE